MNDGDATQVTRGDPSCGRMDAEAYERLLSDVSLRFAGLAFDRIEQNMRDTIELLRDRFGFNRATYSEFTAPGRIAALCTSAVPDIELVPFGRIVDDLRWFSAELLAGRVIAQRDLPGDLPPQAAPELERCRLQHVRAHLSIPLRVGSRVVGALSFSRIEPVREWAPEVVRRLTILGEVIATALDRARIEHESRHLRDRLMHADRVARTGAMAGALAHELNQPISAILSNAQAALRQLRNADATTANVRAAREALEAIERDDRRASETIRSVRRLLRRETVHEPLDVGKAVEEVLALMRSELRERRVEVETRIEPQTLVEGSWPQLQQVALNLVQNAIDAMGGTPEPDRRLRVEVGPGTQGRVRIRFEDSGAGVPADRAEAIFEPLWTSRPNGVGLGLAICRAIVEAHDGGIRLVAGTGRGAAFEVDLPALAHDAVRARPTASAIQVAALATPGSTGSALVGIVDDDPSIREALARLLAGAGYHVRAWSDGRRLLDDPCLPDMSCVLLDVRMPGLDGPDVHALMRERGLQAQVVYLSAIDDVGEGVRAMKRGATDFLVKPVSGDVLLAAVRAAVERDAERRTRALELAARRERLERLTARERDVMREVLRGRLNKQIAADLGISEPTVKQHRARVMDKMAVRSVAELIRACDAILPADGRAGAQGRPLH